VGLRVKYLPVLNVKQLIDFGIRALTDNKRIRNYAELEHRFLHSLKASISKSKIVS